MIKTMSHIIGLIVLAVCVPLLFLGLSEAEKGKGSNHPTSPFPVTQITHNQMTSESDLREVIENLTSGSPDYELYSKVVFDVS